MTVGLIRGETAGDLRTLAATGASSATRRTLNATSAGALALLGGILSTATAYLALIAWHWHDISYLNQPPYANLAVLILGLPATAVVGAWILGRTPGSGLARLGSRCPAGRSSCGCPQHVGVALPRRAFRRAP